MVAESDLGRSSVADHEKGVIAICPIWVALPDFPAGCWGDI